MASEATATQDQSEDSQADRNMMTVKTLSDVGLKAARDSLFEEQYPPGMDYAMKVRKPYTITKQRERWSEEEHKKFLEALKLYGRAWRKIEEHVGTKTAVQIRSHAQKFFSKVARESTNEELTSVKPIEIPPPRPKRKPMHPYPRKLASPLKAERSTTPNLSISELENQSPTSVLSAIGSEFQGTADSSSQNGSLSPVSSVAGGKCGGLLFSESTLSAQPSESPLKDHPHPISVSDDQEPKKLELFPDDTKIVQDEIVEDTSSQTLKLFGKTVLVTDSIRSSSHMPDTFKSLSSDTYDVIRDKTFACNFSPERTFDELNIGSQTAALYYAQFLKDCSNPQGDGSGFALPWLAFYGGLPFFNAPLDSPVLTKANQSFVSEQTQDISVNKETCSNTTELDKECSEKVLLVREKALSDKPVRGFVPYKKRCMREKDTNSSTLTSDESEEKRFRLYL